MFTDKLKLWQIYCWEKKSYSCLTEKTETQGWEKVRIVTFMITQKAWNLPRWLNRDREPYSNSNKRNVARVKNIDGIQSCSFCHLVGQSVRRSIDHDVTLGGGQEGASGQSTTIVNTFFWREGIHCPVQSRTRNDIHFCTNHRQLDPRKSASCIRKLFFSMYFCIYPLLSYSFSLLVSEDTYQYKTKRECDTNWFVFASIVQW